MAQRENLCEFDFNGKRFHRSINMKNYHGNIFASRRWILIYLSFDLHKRLLDGSLFLSLYQTPLRRALYKTTRDVRACKWFFKPKRRKMVRTHYALLLIFFNFFFFLVHNQKIVLIKPILCSNAYITNINGLLLLLLLSLSVLIVLMSQRFLFGWINAVRNCIAEQWSRRLEARQRRRQRRQQYKCIEND